MLAKMKTIFSIDVEEWFHLADTPTISKEISKWDSYPARVEEAFKKLLDILDEHNTKATCFFLGWIAEKYPKLVKLAYDKGHEIALHGYYHNLAYNQTYDEFYNEIKNGKNLIESLINDKIYGFRAPAFSITKQNLWVYEALMELGFKYSSSISPLKYKKFGLLPKAIHYKNMQIIEIPLPVLKFPFSSFSNFGGGRFRLFPVWWFNLGIKFMTTDILTFYIHPRDIDPKHPNVRMPLKRKILSLIKIKQTAGKIGTILERNTFVPFSEVVYKLKNEKLEHTTLCISNDRKNIRLQCL